MLTKKERAILYLLDKAGKISKIRLVKLTFLLSENRNFYGFVPYNYGPFSFELYHDLSQLEKDGYVSMEEEFVAPVEMEFSEPDPESRAVVDEYYGKFSNYDDEQLMNYIYSRYPEYTIFSLHDRRMPYERDSTGIVTIGYEGKSIDTFLYELILHKVGVIVDVRRNAYSMKFGFYKDKLVDYLEKLGIGYVHMPELGVSSKLRKGLETTEDYRALFAYYEKGLDQKTEFLKRIKEIAKKKKVALMCFEKDEEHCHRGVIAEKLRKEGVGVVSL